MKKTKTSQPKSKSASKPARKPTISVREPMAGCDLAVACLEREGVDTIFAYPGGASMQLHQSLTKSKKIRTILPRHEQGGSFMAEGYARATGKPGVCMATSGPGATNLVTGIADAYLDSTPLIAITGQVPRHMIGKGAFQETDVFGVTLPVCKHNYMVMDTADLPRVFKEAFHIATTGRPGPVVIDIPKDVQGGRTLPNYPDKIDLPGFPPPPQADDLTLHELLGLIEKAERPVLYVGGGIISSEASAALLKFAEATHIPVTTTLMGVGCFPETHDLSLKWLGMHGSVYANYAVDESDLLIAMGVRFDDRVTGKVSAFAKNATIVHIEVDNAEINKNKVVHLPILSDVKYALDRLNAIIKGENRQRKHFPRWIETINGWKKKYPFSFHPEPGRIMPQQIIKELDELTRGNLIMTTGVGQHQMWAGQFYKFTKPRTFVTSAGLGSMGYGYPAAIGAKVARPDMEVIDIDGDGSFIMNIQELATAVAENIAAKAIVINNQHLGMVAQWEDKFFNSNRGHTFLGRYDNRKAIYPDFVKICEGFDVPAERITDPRDLRSALKRMLDAKTAYVLDVMVPYCDHVLPMIPAGATVKEMIKNEAEAESAEKGDIPG
jgi:acetolactate synthase-1/2/3 large subunit